VADGAGLPTGGDPGVSNTTAPRIRDGLRDVTLAFVGARVLLAVVSVVGSGILTLPQDQPTGVPGWPAREPDQGWVALVTATERQDALWYLRIATDGYTTIDASAAFFPGYPLLIRAVDVVPGVGPLGAALVVAHVATFVALLLLHALTRLELRGDDARRAVVLLALFPTAFFLLSPYAEAPFLALSIACFWFARRSRWWWAAAAGAGAAFTRSVGVLLVVGLATEALAAWRRRSVSPVPGLAAAAGVFAGPLLVAAYWRASAGETFAALDAQRNWARETAVPLETLWTSIRYAATYQTYWLIDLVVVGVVVAGIVVAARHVALGYTTYAAASVLLPLTFPFPDRPLLSMPRFVLVIFPAFWGLAIAGRRPAVHTALVAGSAAGYALLGVLFINWHYIF